VNRLLSVTGLLILIFCSCGRGTGAGGRNEEANADSAYVPGRFSLEDISGIRKLVISNPWQNSRGIELVYYLVPEDMELPDTLNEADVIRIPVRRIVCMSVTHIAMLRALGATDAIVGISGTGLLFDTLLREEVKRGTLPDVGYESNLDRELVVSLKPDLLMAYNIGAPSEYMRKLESMGVRVMYNADYLEQHPLARCGWIRVFGALTGREEMADSILGAVTSRYNELAEKVKHASSDRPGVLLGAPWEDSWYVSPSNSYIGRLVNDAGGRYLFDDLKAPNSVPFSVEAVFRRAADADVWLNPGAAGSLAEIEAADRRLARLPVYREGNVWNNRKRITPAGGNDYWESAVVHPDVLLQDLVSILHPELLPGYDQFYYLKLQ
jgi:iron complex transport system substrate-binding protein